MLNSLVKKIFFSIFAMFLFVILIQLLFQNFILEDIYQVLKVIKLERNFEAFIDDFKEEHWNEKALENEISLYDESASIIIFDENHQIVNDSFFESFNYITIRDHKGKEYKVIIDFLVDERGKFRNPNNEINYNEIITVEATPIEGTVFLEPLEIYKKDNQYTNDDGYSTWHDKYNNTQEVLVSIQGEVIGRNFILREDGVRSYQSEKLYDEVKNFWNEISINSELAESMAYGDHYIYTEEYSGLQIMVLTEEVKNINGERFFVFSLSTFENIHDAFQVLNGYYYYIFLFQLLLIGILVFFYSKWITCPMLELIDSAKSISELDFTKRTTIRTNDELSVLSKSLNSISLNLSSTIDQLESSNDRLGLEVQRRAENEARMRNLLTSLSHEFKTPLGIMSGFLEILQDDVGDKPPEYYMSVISDEIDKLNKLVLETIELSKLEAGTYKMAFSEFEGRAFLESVIDKFDKRIKDKNMTLETRILDHRVIGDMTKLEQVMTNIISNGIRYSPENEKIEIVSKIVDNRYHISVINYGITIPEDDIDKLWDRFYRTEKSRNRHLGGSGLGLAIVKNILDLHESEYGIKNIEEGVAFKFTLKIVQE